MYVVIISLLAQIVCLTSLCWSSSEHYYLLWYIPNWIASALILFPLIENSSATPSSDKKNTKENHKIVVNYFVNFVFLALFVFNFLVTYRYLERNWVLACPALVSTLTFLSLDYYDTINTKIASGP